MIPISYSLKRLAQKASETKYLVKDGRGFRLQNQAPSSGEHHACTLIDFPTLRQAYQYSCGANCVQTLMQYYGYDVRENAIMNKLKVTKDGTEVSNIIKYLKANGFNVESGIHTIDDLIKNIKKGTPVILPLQAYSDGDSYAKNYRSGHYVTAIGYTDKHIIFSDPSSVYDTYLTHEELDERWHDTGINGKDFEHFAIIPKGKDPEYSSSKILRMP